MKKLLLLAFGVFLSASLHAQYQSDIIKASKKISKEATPKQIIDSLKKRFPNAKAIAYYKTHNEAAKNGWKVTEEDHMDEDEAIELYTLSFKRADFQYYALFRADGTLISSKYEQYNKDLPKAAKASLKNLGGGDYKNYNLVSKTYYKTVDYKHKKNYYEIVATLKTDPKVKKKITLDETGKIIKVK